MIKMQASRQARNGITTSENQTTPKTRTSATSTTPMAIRNVRLSGGLTLTVMRAATARIKATNSAAAYWNAPQTGRLGEVGLAVIVMVTGWLTIRASHPAAITKAVAVMPIATLVQRTSRLVASQNPPKTSPFWRGLNGFLERG